HWMFTTFQTGNWMPLTWLSLALDHRLGQLNPMVYHLDNLLLHGLNTFLVFFLSLKLLNLTKRNEDQRSGAIPAAFLTAILFGLHPIHVESTAWATERKDVLCGVFFLSSLLVYLKYAVTSTKSKYYLCLVLFALALMSKPMAVT